MDIYFYNTLSRTKEKFVSLDKDMVRMYTCGPTVYDFQHIGNWRTFVFEDLLRRVLRYNGYEVNQVMNATDVGHLTGDNLGLADEGEDRMEKAARREKKDIWEVAQFYIDDFVKTREWLSILPPTRFVRATDHIGGQITLIQKLLEKDLAYITKTGVFFDVLKFPEYGKLGGQKLVDKRVATREELVADQTKHNPVDFALWKFSKSQDQRQMEWDSPWGTGFPGWHIECSAMSMKYLGESFDIHTGGVDHIAIHHSNEIAQSEGATGKPLAKYWLHGQFLTVDGGRMGKSLENAYTLHDIAKRGFNPLALRYLYLTAHYRTVLNFSWGTLRSAQKAFDHLNRLVKDWGEAGIGCAEYEEKFLQSVNNDLDLPGALAVVWDLVKSDYPASAKKATLIKFDEVLGLNLKYISSEPGNISLEAEELLKLREEARLKKDFSASDEARRRINSLGYLVEDTASGPRIKKK